MRRSCRLLSHRHDQGVDLDHLFSSDLLCRSPSLQFIVPFQDTCEDKLDAKLFPYFGGGPMKGAPRAASSGSMSARYGQWHREKSQQTRCGPRLIFFILGGVSYSEMRAAYEVMSSAAGHGKQWDILVGGTHLLVPEGFIGDLEKLSFPPGSITSNIGGGVGGAPGSESV